VGWDGPGEKKPDCQVWGQLCGTPGGKRGGVVNSKRGSVKKFAQEGYRGKRKTNLLYIRGEKRLFCIAAKGKKVEGEEGKT